MQYKVKVTVIDKKLYPELQEAYCADPQSGACPCYNVGDTFVFERYGLQDDFWHMGLNTLKETQGTAAGVAGGPAMPHCSEAWDAISRYIYTGLQGGSIMRGWMRDEHQMIACCSDGTRPVIFKNRAFGLQAGEAAPGGPDKGSGCPGKRARGTASHGAGRPGSRGSVYGPEPGSGR